MRILALVLAGCGATPAPPPPLVGVAAAPSGSSEAPAPPDAPVADIESSSIVVPSPTPGRTPRVPTSSVALSPRDQNAAAIRSMVKRHLSAIVVCYETWSPNALPKVVVRFTIGPDGRVQSSQASGAQAGLENCIAKIYGSFVFPPPAGGGTVTVTYPLNFDTAGN